MCIFFSGKLSSHNRSSCHLTTVHCHRLRRRSLSPPPLPPPPPLPCRRRRRPHQHHPRHYIIIVIIVVIFVITVINIIIVIIIVTILALHVSYCIFLTVRTIVNNSSVISLDFVVKKTVIWIMNQMLFTLSICTIIYLYNWYFYFLCDSQMQRYVL